MKPHCDACDKVLEFYNDPVQLKVKKLIRSWNESWWYKIILCHECYLGIRNVIRNKRD